MAKKRQSGAASIFIVIFAALLLTTLTVGFIRLMLQNQQRSSNNDLSQSALDSALAGVEDAKRAIRTCIAGGADSAAACEALAANPDCKVIARSGVAGAVTDEETIVRSNTGTGEQFNQAYTCVNIAMATDDYLYTAQEDGAELIPLKATGDISNILIEWYTNDDAGVGNLATAPGVSSGLPTKANWGTYTPPLVRAQVIRPGESFDIASLDSSAASQTVFLRPGAVANGTTTPFQVDVSAAARARATDGTEHSNGTSSPMCSRNFANNGYACQVQLNLGDVIPVAQTNNAFLRLNTVYKGATVRVSLRSNTGAVQFDGVQPAVDATGRANTLFRRVEARLRIGDDFPYPNYAADVANSLCKNFSVNTDGAIASGCTP